jgi:arsenate reductase
MAEGIMNAIGGDRFEAHSAGTYPADVVNPLAVEALAAMHIDISSAVPKSLDVYLNNPWDFIITLCDDAKEACPVFPGQAVTAHWGFEDPATFEGTDEQKQRFYRETAMNIEWRIRLLLDLPEAKLDELEAEHAIRHIGTQSRVNA